MRMPKVNILGRQSSWIPLLCSKSDLKNVAEEENEDDEDGKGDL